MMHYKKLNKEINKEIIRLRDFEKRSFTVWTAIFLFKARDS